MRTVRRIAAVFACAAACASFLVPAVAVAQDYDLNFTLPTAGKSGCMVCHGDKNLGVLQGDQFVSYWVDGAILDESAHAGIMCTGCHIDFAYKSPHNIEQTDWVRTARLSCKNCHQAQWDAYSRGSHSLAIEPGEEMSESEAAKPLCGDCHGPSHGIMTLTDNPEAKEELHQNGYEICGKCHAEEWDSYSDYYHGAAYRRGAPDAPSCWQCHDYHAIQPSTSRDSTVYEGNLAETCGQCHEDPSDKYLEYAGLVHRRDEVRSENPLYRFMDSAKGTIEDVFGTIRSWFT